MKTLFWKKMYFNSRSNFAKSRSAIYSVSSKAVMITQCNAIRIKMNLVCVAKVAKIEMKKKWIGKINKITKKPSRGSFVKQTFGTVYLT